MLAILAQLPILTALVLVIGLRVTATKAIPLAWVVACSCAFGVGFLMWTIPSDHGGNSGNWRNIWHHGL